MDYNPSSFEQKWQQYWAENGIYKVIEDPNKPKYYVLDMFPYPSGAGLHVGHPLGYIATDIISRFKRMNGYSVLHPMGFDAFGLPAEQYAIETGQHPRITTEQNIKRYKEQLTRIGFDYDWSREVITSDPKYYKWTQWIFLKLFNSWYNPETDRAEPLETFIEGLTSKGTVIARPDPGRDEVISSGNQIARTRDGALKGKAWDEMNEVEQQQLLMTKRLAYQSYADVNWCPALGTVLANDEVKDGVSERGGHPVYRMKMRQWFLRITAYAERLLKGLDTIEWPESLKEMQRNWIGKSEGATIRFDLTPMPSVSGPTPDPLPVRQAGLPLLQAGSSEGEGSLVVFTTRPDTIFGATFMVLAPEHDLVKQLITVAQREKMTAYLDYVKKRSDRDRMAEKKVTGEFTGSYAINPITRKEIPIYVAEYVLSGYGTGAIMGVPGDDLRDRAFAEKFGLPIIEIIDRPEGAQPEDRRGKLKNSDFLNGMEVPRAISAIIHKLEEMGIGERKVQYKMRDAGFSRQRYWGEPFPIYYPAPRPPAPEPPMGEASAAMPRAIPESALPLLLPEIDDFRPTGDGKSPLAKAKDWTYPPFGGGGAYETDTMPGYAGSSWYFLRYMDPHNENEFASKKAIDYWQNVDFYVGGAEHAVGHLLYSRMWHKFLKDLGYVTTEEPFKKMVNQGMIQGKSAYTYIANLIPAPKSGAIDMVDPTRESSAPTVFNSWPQLFVSSDYVDQWDMGDPKTERPIAEKVKELWAVANPTENPDQYSFNLAGFSKRLIPIEFVSASDEIDVDAFLAYRKNMEPVFGTAVLLYKGRLRCHREPEKMSKSKHNVINPDDVIEQYGADALRMYEMFLGPIEVHKPWDTNGIDGVVKFLRKFWNMSAPRPPKGETNASPPTPKGEVTTLHPDEEPPTEAELRILHKTIKKVTEDIERLSFNTAVSAFMICLNELSSPTPSASGGHPSPKGRGAKRALLDPLVRLLAPFAPHITEEIWQNVLGNKGSVHLAEFPKWDERYVKEDSFEYPVSINGKTRARISFPLSLSKEEIEKQVLTYDTVSKWIDSGKVKKVIVVPGRIINVVT